MHESLRSLNEMERRLRERRGLVFPAEPGLTRASVALVIHGGADGPGILLIRRADAAHDPWSGHMALPGGRQDPDDRDAQATAVRETREEVGIDLSREARSLGRLQTLRPRNGPRPVAVSPFVFRVPAPLPLCPNHEVAAARWVPLAELIAPEARCEYELSLPDGTRLRFPGLRCADGVVWGLTYRVLSDFFAAVLPDDAPDLPPAY